MKDYLKSQTLILSLALWLSAILSFTALDKNSCFEISLNEKTNIKAGLCNKKN